LEPSGKNDKRETNEDLEEVSCGRGTERREDVEGGEEVGCGQRSLAELRGSLLLPYRRLYEMMMMMMMMMMMTAANIEGRNLFI
jgi:hypothetical protein